MTKLKVAVLFGGKSSEYSVSLHSASSALRNMPKDYQIILIGITPQGNWYEYKGSIDAIEQDKWRKGNITPATLSLNPQDHGFILRGKTKTTIKKVDVIFPILHGINGEDGTVQAACHLANIPCVGCKMTSSTLCMDKEFTHIVAEHCDVPMAKWLCVKKNSMPDLTKLYRKVSKELGIPCIIKPCNAGSSYGVSKAKDKESFMAGIYDALRYDDKLIIEEFMQGFEVGCAVLGNDELIVGEPDEIEMKDDIFNFKEKYTPNTSVIHVPARVSGNVKKQIVKLATTIYRGLDCQGMARVDCFVVKNKVYLNELNTIPGFTSHSRYPSMMKAVGHSLEDVIKNLVDLALKSGSK